MKTINVGIAGFGYMGKMHAMCYENLKYYYDIDVKVNLYAVVTSKREEDLPIHFEKIYNSPLEMIKDREVDVIDICLPNYMHKDVLLEAIKYNKYIYCEKPLALDLESAEKVLETVRATGYNKTNRVTFEYRFVPAIVRAKQLISENAIGNIIQFNCKYYGSEFLDPERPLSWQSDKDKSGGGVLYALGTHSIDLIRYLVGDIDNVYASKKTYIKERPVKGQPSVRKKVETEDIVNVQLECINGAIGTLMLSQVAAGAGVDFSFEVYGEKGAIKFDQSNPNVIMYYDDQSEKGPVGGYSGYKAIETMQKYGGKAIFPPPRVNIAWSRYHIASIYDFIDAVSKNVTSYPDMEDGFRVQQVADAIYRSCNSGHIEKV